MTIHHHITGKHTNRHLRLVLHILKRVPLSSTLNSLGQPYLSRDSISSVCVSFILTPFSTSSLYSPFFFVLSFSSFFFLLFLSPDLSFSRYSRSCCFSLSRFPRNHPAPSLISFYPFTACPFVSTSSPPSPSTRTSQSTTHPTSHSRSLGLGLGCTSAWYRWIGSGMKRETTIAVEGKNENAWLLPSRVEVKS